MINHLKHMAIFARVVDEGSFRRAAKTLNLAPSRTSQTVADLEQYLGVTLLYRSTRKLVLTSEGAKFYTHALEMLKNAEAGLNELNALSQQHIGTLRISLPAFLTYSTISTAIAEFAKQYPKVTLSLMFTDHIVDILNEGIDMSIRVGWLQDSTMMSRKLYDGRRLLVASNKYLASKVTPTHPSDLLSWDWIRFDIRSSSVEFESPTGEKVSITENTRFSVNSADALSSFVKKHMGLAYLPEHIVADDIKNGDLVHVLPEWKLKSLGYYAVWPNKSRRENLTLLLVRFLAENC
ncbi:LysR family transcriptional regulator [Psychrosphaera saromensis]|uniref:Transcriptional regulator n=1 Tax=Psychrosphaera saromensis TaxID=716813 RepID=A0A2S7UTB1_9GAMM|nr:LysR family transcriptional regulator [Psychrosphaera saromensis]PQJ52979.1 transcriptional regulator [Psychrosphaera saromensis]GHB77456.1 LysR family transcriptional regulator [Psychrosphaera saromensis]GLQ12861.1 LysR family transcriptional regulator [Psychrosphaera saromensis]